MTQTYDSINVAYKNCANVPCQDVLNAIYSKYRVNIEL